MKPIDIMHSPMICSTSCDQPCRLTFEGGAVVRQSTGSFRLDIVEIDPNSSPVLREALERATGRQNFDGVSIRAMFRGTAGSYRARTGNIFTFGSAAVLDNVLTCELGEGAASLQASAHAFGMLHGKRILFPARLWVGGEEWARCNGFRELEGSEVRLLPWQIKRLAMLTQKKPNQIKSGIFINDEISPTRLQAMIKRTIGLREKRLDVFGNKTSYSLGTNLLNILKHSLDMRCCR